jgi:hypothetical protein
MREADWDPMGLERNGLGGWGKEGSFVDSTVVDWIAMLILLWK